MPLIEYVAAGGIIIHDEQMLLLDRPSRDEIRLPKGHVEQGESDADAALRETIEETGLAGLAVVADLGTQVVEFDYQGDHYRRTEHYYLMAKVGDETLPRSPKDAADFQPFWARLEDVLLLLTYPGEQSVARKAITCYRQAHGQAGPPSSC
ncbi:MAG: hypothetical protein DCC57_05670 [Chloroflexi bacterium]|nr:MAG: hypothetical protein DCC57_05670 [Chloroflexota bacterium]